MTDPRAEAYAPVMPYLAVPDARKALGFYARAFGAETVHEVPDGETGGLAHARMIVNGAMVMLHDDNPDAGIGVTAPDRLGGTSLTIRLRLEAGADVDALVARAAEAGATVLMPPDDAPWGERYARLCDPFGHAWAVGGPL